MKGPRPKEFNLQLKGTNHSTRETKKKEKKEKRKKKYFLFSPITFIKIFDK